MLRTLLATTAVFALSTQAGLAASPFGVGTASEDISDAKETRGDDRNLLEVLTDGLSIALNLREDSSGNAEEDAPENSYYDKEQCEAKGADGEDDELADDDSEETEPTGPEPIYFGF